MINNFKSSKNNFKKDKIFKYIIDSSKFLISSTTNNDNFYVEFNPKNDHYKIIAQKGIISISQKGNIKSKKLLLSDKNIIIIPSEFLLNQVKKRALKDNDISSKDIIVLKKAPSFSKYDSNFKINISKDPFFHEKNIKINQIVKRREYRNKDIFYFEGQIGLSFISNNFYFLLGFYPKIKYKLFGIKFRFETFFLFKDFINMNKLYNKNEWLFDSKENIIGNIINKIEYAYYGNLKKTYLLEFRNFSDVTMAYGLNLLRYRNDIFSPFNKTLGFRFFFKSPSFSIKGLVSQINRLEIFSFRLETIPIYNSTKLKKDQFELGLTFSMDLDPLNSDKNPSIFIMSFDSRIPVLNYEKYNFKLDFLFELSIQGIDFSDIKKANQFGFDDHFHFFDKSLGLMGGFKIQFINIIKFYFNFRYLFKGHISEYIDSFYEIKRIEKAKVLLIKNKSDFLGFLFGINVKITDLGYFYGEFYFETGNIPNFYKLKNRFHLELKSNKKFIPFFNLSIYWDQLNIDSFSSWFKKFINNNTLIGAKIEYSPINWIDFILDYHSFFEEKNSAQIIILKVNFIV